MSADSFSSSPLRQLPVIQNSLAAASGRPASAGQAAGKTASMGEDTDFRQLLTLAVMGMAMPSSSGPAGGMGELVAPLMLALLERLTENPATGESSTPAAPVTIPQGLPVQGQLTQKSHAGHVALDIGVPLGTPVKATMDGKVVYAGWNDQGYGNLVIVDNGEYKTYYAHLSKIPVQVGDQVQARQVIGLSGSTGNSTGPHLHYEVRIKGTQVDPQPFTKEPGSAQA